MERTMSIEEKIRRAEEIYARRQESTQRKTATVTMNSENKKDIKLFKKMIIQILISLSIYLVIYVIQNNNYIFSEEFLNKANEILSYDINFVEIYENLKQNIEQRTTKINNENEGASEEEESNNNENAIGGAIENNVEDTNIIQTNEENTIQDNVQKTEENISTEQLSQEEQDIKNIKATTTFIKPVEGTISSRYGLRNPTTSTVPTNHTGLDIATNIGTKIIASTGGKVVLASEKGDYGKHIKIQIGEVCTIYAHCNSLYVKEGDIITQGQEIAEVGSTGNSTGPHLHFEIRISERKIDPEKILEF